MSSWILGLFLACYGLKWLVEAGLLALNLAHVRAMGDRVPAALAGQVTRETAGRSAAYTWARGRLALVEHVAEPVLVLGLLLSGALPALERLLGAGAGPIPGLGGLHLSAAFLAALALAGMLAGLPFSLVSTFGIERRFGFNRQTWRGWLGDRLKGLALAAALGLPFLYAVLGLMAWSSRWWWVWLFGFVTAYQLLMAWLFPVWIAPLFNRFTPLPEGELRSRVEALARSAGFRTRGIFTMDASRRTGHSNAFFTGIGRAKRIVLFDTLLERMSSDETISVLAHEIGHYRLRHVARRIGIGIAATGVLSFVLSLLAEWTPLYEAFGFAAPSAHALLALLALCGGAFTFWFTPLSSWYSRRHEFAADAYAVRLAAQPQALQSALIGLNGQNLSNLHPHPWYSRYYYSHPPLTERLAAIERLGGAGARAAPDPA
jgi:STE24 endopeptidase